MSNAMTKRTESRELTPQQKQYVTIRDYLMSNAGALAKVMPKYLDSERMVRLALGAAQRSPKLLECTPRSWLAALMDCSYYGLEPNPALGHAYLVPFRNKHAKNQMEVTFIPGYKGLILLACRSKAFVNVDARAVFENEYRQGRFKETPHDPDAPFFHEPLYGSKDVRGAYFGFYAVGWIRRGERAAFRFCPMDEIRDTRKRARAADSGPWTTDFVPMAKKTAVRRLMTLAPIQAGSKLDDALNHERVLQGGRVAHANDWSQVIGGARMDRAGDLQAGVDYDEETGEVRDEQQRDDAPRDGEQSGFEF